jgi:hypothetical protein
MKCTDCNRQWNDVYRLDGVSEIHLSGDSR